MSFQEVSSKRPELLNFFPPPSDESVKHFEKEIGFALPQSLKAFWCRWGTGSAFETEDFFSPTEDADTGESVFSVNQECRAYGLPNHLVVFHRGLGGLTCIDKKGHVSQVDESDLEVVRTFSSIEDWFESVLMHEYGRRYGLR